MTAEESVPFARICPSFKRDISHLFWSNVWRHSSALPTAAFNLLELLVGCQG